MAGPCPPWESQTPAGWRPASCRGSTAGSQQTSGARCPFRPTARPNICSADCPPACCPCPPPPNQSPTCPRPSSAHLSQANRPPACSRCPLRLLAPACRGFGTVLWELMTWQVPFDQLNPFQVGVGESGSRRGRGRELAGALRPQERRGCWAALGEWLRRCPPLMFPRPARPRTHSPTRPPACCRSSPLCRGARPPAWPSLRPTSCPPGGLRATTTTSASCRTAGPATPRVGAWVGVRGGPGRADCSSPGSMISHETAHSSSFPLLFLSEKHAPPRPASHPPC